MYFRNQIITSIRNQIPVYVTLSESNSIESDDAMDEPGFEERTELLISKRETTIYTYTSCSSPHSPPRPPSSCHLPLACHLRRSLSTTRSVKSFNLASLAPRLTSSSRIRLARTLASPVRPIHTVGLYATHSNSSINRQQQSVRFPSNPSVITASRRLDHVGPAQHTHPDDVLRADHVVDDDQPSYRSEGRSPRCLLSPRKKPRALNTTCLSSEEDPVDSPVPYVEHPHDPPARFPYWR